MSCHLIGFGEKNKNKNSEISHLRMLIWSPALSIYQGLTVIISRYLSGWLKTKNKHGNYTVSQ